MVYLGLHILLWLALAFLLGCLIGWLLRGASIKRLQGELDACMSKRKTLEAEIRRLEQEKATPRAAAPERPDAKATPVRVAVPPPPPPLTPEPKARPKGSEEAAAPKAPAPAPEPKKADPAPPARSSARSSGSDSPDDLKKIFGIGKVIEGKLHKMGVTTFKQIADFTTEDITRVAESLDSFPDRIERDDWVEQARKFHAEKYL